MDPLTNPAFLLFAAIAPLLIALAKQDGLAPQYNALIALVGYFVVGIAGALVSGTPLDLAHLVDLIAIATLVGKAAYDMVWSNLLTGPTGALPSLDQRLTRATSFRQAA